MQIIRNYREDAVQQTKVTLELINMKHFNKPIRVAEEEDMQPAPYVSDEAAVLLEEMRQNG